jgi:hypothetical protein
MGSLPMTADRTDSASDRPLANLAALAGGLLGRAEATPAPAPASEAQTEIAMMIPEPLRSPELLAAIEAFERGADPLAVESAVSHAELFAELRVRDPKARVRAPSDYALMMVTTGSGQRLLPLLSSAERLRAHAGSAAVIGAPLSATRALELALGMGFDGVEIDRGSAQAYRLSRLQMQRLHTALYQTIV